MIAISYQPSATAGEGSLTATAKEQAMSVEDRHIVGSAEPLSPAERAIRIRELQDWGVDLSLVQANLELTPTQRIEAARGLLAFAEEMRRAWRKWESSTIAAAERQGSQGNAATL
jgi:hypothetical protein